MLFISLVAALRVACGPLICLPPQLLPCFHARLLRLAVLKLYSLNWYLEKWSTLDIYVSRFFTFSSHSPFVILSRFTGNDYYQTGINLEEILEYGFFREQFLVFLVRGLIM